MGNLRNGKIDYSDLAYTSDDADISTYTLNKDDLLFNRTNSREWVGKTAIYKGEYPAIYAGYLVKIRPILVIPDFLNLVMNSPHERSYCHKVKSDGINQSNVNAKKIGELLIPIPPLSEQKRIVNRFIEIEPFIDAYSVYSDRLINLNNSINEKLKNSLLQYTIQGKLVPQDPNDEPASVLLERIRAEKEQLIKEGKIKRDKNDSYIYRGSDNSYYEKFVDDNEVCIDEEIPFEIPDSWCWCRVKHISEVKGGKRLPKGYSFSESITPHCYIRVTDMKNQSIFLKILIVRFTYYIVYVSFLLKLNKR